MGNILTFVKCLVLIEPSDVNCFPNANEVKPIFDNNWQKHDLDQNTK